MAEEKRPQHSTGRPPMVGIKDVARHAGVSATTVSNVLNSTNRISRATRARVLNAVRELGYVRNAAAHQLRAGSTAIGLIVPDGSNPFYAAIARGAEDAAWERGGSVLIGNSNNEVERESRHVSLFEQHRVAGMLISPIADTASRIDSLVQRGVATVVVGRTSHPERCSSVSIDNVAGGRIATRHLLDIGRRRLAFVGPVGRPGAVERLAGAKMAVTEVEGAALEEINSGLTVQSGRAVGESLAGRPTDHRPDAVFCTNDLLATGVLHAFVDAGVHVPDEVAIIGFDDIELAASAIVPLSSIRQPADLIGRTAVELLYQELADRTMRHRHVLFPPELVIRGSTVGGTPDR